MRDYYPALGSLVAHVVEPMMSESLYQRNCAFLERLGLLVFVCLDPHLRVAMEGVSRVGLHPSGQPSALRFRETYRAEESFPAALGMHRLVGGSFGDR